MRKARRPAARAHAHEALLRFPVEGLRADVARLPLCVLGAQLAAASLAKCSIQAVIDSFDINVCAVGMLPRGFGRKDYVVAPDVEQAIRSKTMRLRPQHNTTPGRVEKYQSRGFTLLA